MKIAIAALLFVGSAFASSVETSVGYYYTGTPFADGIVPIGDFFATTNSYSSAPAASGVVGSSLPVNTIGGLGVSANAIAGLTTAYDPYLKINGQIAGNPTPGGWVTMSATVSDTLTVAGGPANGTLEFTYTLIGSVSSTQGVGAAQQLEGQGAIVRVNGGNPVPLPNMPNQMFTPISEEGVFSVPYVNGIGVYSLTLEGMASCVAPQQNDPFCDSNIDLGDTLNITGLQVLNSLGNPVSNIDVTSQSGLNYLALPGSVDAPEPSSLGFIGGLFGLALLVRTKYR